MKVFIVGHFGETEIIGVFSDERKAYAAASAAANLRGEAVWVGPIEVDQPFISEGSIEWPGSYVVHPAADEVPA